MTIDGHVQVDEEQVGHDTDTVMMNAGADEDDESEYLTSVATQASQNPVNENVNYYDNDAGQKSIDGNGDHLSPGNKQNQRGNSSFRVDGEDIIEEDDEQVDIYNKLDRSLSLIHI